MRTWTAWLIEYVGATPFPVYVPEVYIDGCHTVNAFAARHFETKEAAQAHMIEHGYNFPWAAIEHGFSQ